ncbi:MAG: DUF2760 domain-containing protein [Bacteroidales bacterium]|nr:DUF2760 domain-containing protein [Bacteroidales bacterium]
MDMLFLGLVLGAGLVAFLVAVVAFARAGGIGQAFWGLSIAGRARADAGFEAEVNRLMGTAAVEPQPASPTQSSGEPLRILALLQSEARLIDFLMEDIHQHSPADIGTAVRDIHGRAQAVLQQYLTIVPVLSESEGSQATVPAGFDPSAIRVIGNVTGQPPYTGEVQHPGWKVREMKLPPTASGQDPLVLQPAEVQI